MYRIALALLMKDLVRDGWRTVITIINLTVFLCCYFCLAAVAKAAAEFGTQEEDRSSLMIIQNNVFDPGDSILTEEQFTPIRELMPGMVNAVSPMIFRLLKIESQLIQVRAAPLADLEPVYKLELVSGNWPATEFEAVIGGGTAAMTGWEVGRTIRIFGRDFIITGVISSPGTKSSAVWIDLAAAENLFGTSGVYQFAWANVTPGVSAEEVQAILQTDARLSERYQVYFVDHLYEQYASALNDIAGLSAVLVLLSLILVMFGTYGSIYLTLSERNRELTILRAVGFSTRSIRSILSGRTLIQVIAAFFASWGISILILKYLSGVHPIVVHAILLEVTITPEIFFVGFILALVFSWVGILLPMIRVSNTEVHTMMAR